MLLIIDNNGNIIQNYGTNSAFPDGNIPNLPKLPEGQTYIRFNDGSYEATQIMTAHEVKINKDKSITIIKTKTQYTQEYNNNPDTIKSKRKKEIQTELNILDERLTRGEEDLIDLLISKGILKETDLSGYLKSRRQQKQQLRQELTNL